jgi:hypothetical protein
MSTPEIQEYVSSQLLASLDGASVENNKFDFKYEWHDLTTVEGQSKFLVDLSAIVNSYGGGQGFLVIGYDETRKQFKGATFSSQSLFKDDADLIQFIKRKVDRPFNVQVIPLKGSDLDGKLHDLTILHLPPSMEKPHVIRNIATKTGDIPHQIFIRKGSVNERATKNDLDIMYLERPSILVEKRVGLTVKASASSFRETSIEYKNQLGLTIGIFIENLGFKPFVIDTIHFMISVGNKQFRCAKTYDYRLSDLRIYQPAEIVFTGIQFDLGTLSEIRTYHRFQQFVQELNKQIEEKILDLSPARVTLSSGEEIICTVNFID